MVGSSNQGLSSVQCKNDLMIIGNVLKSAVRMETGVNLGFVLLQTGISGTMKPAEGGGSRLGVPRAAGRSEEMDLHRSGRQTSPGRGLTR